MSRVTAFIYGALIVLVAIDAMLFGFIPGDFIGIVVIALGILVLFTPLLPYGARAPFQWFRRWFFGAVMIILGFREMGVSFGFEFIEKINVLGALTLDTFVGKLILLIIGAIYFLAAFARTRNMQMPSY